MPLKTKKLPVVGTEPTNDFEANILSTTPLKCGVYKNEDKKIIRIF